MYAGQTEPLTPWKPRAGGTLLECQRLLASQGALAVSAYATHGVFPKGTWSRFLPGSQEGSPGFRCALCWVAWSEWEGDGGRAA